VRNDDNLLRLQARSREGFYEGVCMPDQALINAVRSHRRGEDAMTTTFELLRQKLPAFGPLAAAMYEKVRAHWYRYSYPVAIPA
jgi:hypothetical protein